MKKHIISLTAILALAMPFVAQAEPQFSFGGQYRLNSYYLSDKDNNGVTQAVRARIRQNVDIKFSEAFDTHLQINMGHIRTGVFNHNIAHNGQASFGIRHAVMNYHFSKSLNLIAGIVPLSDKFGDTLFSGDWDFNPITFALAGDTGEVNYRVAYFKISEGTTEMQRTANPGSVDLVEDIDAGIIDLGINAGAVELGVMGLFISSPDNLSTPTSATAFSSSASNYWVGGRVAGEISGIKLNGDVVYANVDKGTKTGALTSTTLDNRRGVQVRGSLSTDVSDVGVGILALYTQGDTDTAGNGTGFISPQSFVGSQGYWGKTGILNIQGPTDTGMDQNMLRTDNNGFGLFTIQGSLSTALNQDWSAYGAVSYFRASKERIVGQGKNIGTDVYAQVKYSFPDSPLALEVFGDIASLGAAHMNSGGKSRSLFAFGSRLQAEF